MTTAFINRIATAVPPHDVHNAFIAFATGMLPEGTVRNLFRRMARLSAIEHRYSFVQPVATEDGVWKDVEQVYVPGSFPATARRMKFFESFAPQLARMALDKLALSAEERRDSHPRDCDLLHRALRAGPGLRGGQPPGLESHRSSGP